MPGLCGTDHIGFTVPNLDDAVDFFVNVIGCEKFYTLGPVEREGDWMKENLGVNPRAKISKICLLRCANGANFEIFEYQAPDQKLAQPKNSDIGGHHIAFYVEDMDAAVTYLKSKGVQLLGEPKVKNTGSNSGTTWIYFLAPWGMQLELMSYPKGQGYEKDPEYKNRRLWHPKS